MFGDNVYEVLVTMLQQAPSMRGVSLLFGEENFSSEDQPLGFVTIYPVGGPWNQPGYFRGANVNLENIWSTKEQMDLVLWSAVDPNADPPPTPAQHATAICNLRRRVLNALQTQQMPGGLTYVPVSGRWALFDNAQNRYGRGYVLSVMVEIPVPADPYPEATVLATQITPSIEEN